MIKDLRHTGTLEYGIEYNGQLHKDFAIRLQTVGDEVDASSLAEIDGGKNYSLHLLCSTLTQLGDIPLKDITVELLRESMLFEDFDIMNQAQKELKKKLKPASEKDSTTDSPGSSSDNTASPKKTSKD